MDQIDRNLKKIKKDQVDELSFMWSLRSEEVLCSTLAFVGNLPWFYLIHVYENDASS